GRAPDPEVVGGHRGQPRDAGARRMPRVITERPALGVAGRRTEDAGAERLAAPAGGARRERLVDAGNAARGHAEVDPVADPGRGRGPAARPGPGGRRDPLQLTAVREGHRTAG